jgi:hypothetical protein
MHTQHMHKRGPKPSRPDGYHITAKGYLRGAFDGRLRLVHTVVWERANGPVPDGYEVHHIDGDKQNPDLANLELLTRRDHKRLHSGCERRDGEWWKPCGLCGEFKPINAEHWYISREGYPLYGRCRPCHIRRVVADKQRRRHTISVSGQGE